MFFKKLVMFYQSLADLCCLPVYPLIIYKSALDKIRLIQDVKGCIVKLVLPILCIPVAGKRRMIRCQYPLLLISYSVL